MRIPMFKIRRSWDHLIFYMGIPLLVRWLLYIETAPRFFITSRVSISWLWPQQNKIVYIFYGEFYKLNYHWFKQWIVKYRFSILKISELMLICHKNERIEQIQCRISLCLNVFFFFMRNALKVCQEWVCHYLVWNGHNMDGKISIHF